MAGSRIGVGSQLTVNEFLLFVPKMQVLDISHLVPIKFGLFSSAIQVVSIRRPICWKNSAKKVEQELWYVRHKKKKEIISLAGLPIQYDQLLGHPTSLEAASKLTGQSGLPGTGRTQKTTFVIKSL